MRISDYLIRPISTSTEPSGQYNLQLEAYNLAVNLINGMTQPVTEVCDIERISDEINKLKKVSDGNKVYVGINDVFEIIDKYTK